MVHSASSKSIRLRYTEEVGTATSEDEGNYEISPVVGGSPLTIALVTRDAIDNAIVVIETAEDQVNASFKVVINNGEDLNGNKVITDTTGCFIGNGPPAVASASASGPSKVVVTFSESISSSDDAATEGWANYAISGLSVTGADWPSGDPGDRTVVELTTSTQLQAIYTVVLAPNVLHAKDDNAPITAGYNSASFQGDGFPSVVSAVALDSTRYR
jgi:hypothetical protein